MIAFLTLCYVAVLALLVKLKVLPNTIATWLSTLAWALLLFIVLFIPLQWGAPSGSARILTYTVQIIPNVSGPVLDVQVVPNKPLNKGDVLFTIDPVTYQAAVDGTRAQLGYQRLRLKQYQKLASSSAGTRFQVQETEAKVKQLEAELATAEWNLKETTVRAPAEGYATYVALRPGQRVTNLPFQPSMTFIDTSRSIVSVQINQIYQRHLKIGQPVELAFKTHPGRIYNGKIKAILQVTSQSQALIGGTVPQAQQVQAEPFFIRVQLEDEVVEKALPAGTVGTAAIYTTSASMTHIIRKVMIRMESYLNFINPWL
jgi:RND family efflux transporter MFP subunit